MKYQYIEDNGGGLYLFVFDDENCVVDGIENLEHATHGEWYLVNDSLNHNAIDEIELWEGHLQDPRKEFDCFMASPFGCSVVCQDGELFPDRMGRAAQFYFGVDYN